MKKLFFTPDIFIATGMFGLAALWSIALTYLGYHDTLYNYYYNPVFSLLYFWGAGMALRAMLKLGLTSRIGKMLGAITLALVSYGLADIVWGYYNVILKVPIPYPSWSDLFFVLYYPCLIAAFIYLLVILKTSITPRFILEAVGIFFISFFLIFFVLIRPTITTEMNLTAFLDIAYPLGDVLILSLALLGFRISGRKIRSVLLIFILATIVEVTADILFSHVTKAEMYFNGSYIDLVYLLNAWLLALGVESVKQNFITQDNLS